VYSCDQVIAELAGYLDDEVAVGMRQELEIHLARCRTCKVIYDSARKALRIVTETRSFDLPESISERIARNIMAKVRPRGAP